MASYKISELLKYRPTARDIRDYSKVNSIFLLYRTEHYETMCREIYWYKDFLFFHDLNIFLNLNIKNNNIIIFYYKDISEIYHANIIETWEEVKRRKTKRSVSY